MKKLSAIGVLVLGFAFCLMSAPAHAQDGMGKISVFGGYSYLSSGTVVCDCEAEDFGGVGLQGYTGAIVYNFNKHVGFEANFAGHNGSPTVFSEAPSADENGDSDKVRDDFYTYTFGPKLTEPLGHFALFAHFLVGGAHIHQGFTDRCLPATDEEGCGINDVDTGNTHGSGFAFKTGGGVDWNHGRWGLRLLEVDYERIMTKSTFNENDEGEAFGPETFNSSANNMSLSAGFTFNFGGMK